MLNLVPLNIKLLTVATFLLQKDTQHQLNGKRQTFEDVYDFIVVGSGSAGGIVAHRLAETKRSTVLLLEAGGPNGVTNDVPIQYIKMFNSEYDWNHTQAEQFVGRAYEGRRIMENVGRVLGGSTSMNAMIYNRGNRKDFDNWAQTYGAEGWAYEDVLPYFKKYENNTDPNLANSRFHGTSGPVQVTTWPDPDPMIVLHQMALNEMGIATTDINGPNQVGTALAQATISKDTGTRQSVANAYLDPNPFPDNLHILTFAMATKLIFREKRAIGVQFVREGLTHTVTCRQEVIVSAGSFHSPQLLMLSGIGPKEHLQEFGIPVVADLPVGKNMTNHPAMNINFLIKEQYQDLVHTGNPFMTIDNLYEFYVNHSGALSKYYNSIIYLSTESNNDHSWPNVAIEAGVLRFPLTFEQWTCYKMHDTKSWDQYFKKFYGKNFIFTQPLLERVRSFGFVRLQSTDPFEAPIINPMFLTHPQDFDDFVSVTRFLFYFYERSSIAHMIERHQPIPGCQLCPNSPFAHECDSYIRCYITQKIYTGFHSTSTCRMGDPRRSDTVVDPRLRVKGFDGLRVCDASIMPIVTNGNTNAPTMMIGEKCADMIKQDNGLF